MNRDEMIGCQEVLKLIKKVIGVITNQTNKVINVVVVENPSSSTETSSMSDNITSFHPELVDAKESAARHLETFQNNLERQDITIIEFESRYFDIAADFPVGHGSVW